MTYVTQKTGMQQKVINLLTETDPKALWTTQEIAEELDVETKKVENAVYNAWTLGKICRHAEKEAGKVRYAAKITGANNLLYEQRPINVANANSKPKKRKGSYATGKEIRMEFANLQRALMRLEDMVMSKVEDAEETEKNLNKLRNLL